MSSTGQLKKLTTTDFPILEFNHEGEIYFKNKAGKLQ